ncbi:hypothetical protein ATN83_3841 [Raoultella ornithinolytica]|nr:hypothetical protein ATN83_3841 [Raoultella ornithinolytica]KDV95341.1 hypothetical protein AB00_0923 [Raoultella ornithinolytica 2-156-04_S1_C1]
MNMILYSEMKIDPGQLTALAKFKICDKLIPQTTITEY